MRYLLLLLFLVGCADSGQPTYVFNDDNSYPLDMIANDSGDIYLSFTDSAILRIEKVETSFDDNPRRPDEIIVYYNSAELCRAKKAEHGYTRGTCQSVINYMKNDYIIIRGALPHSSVILTMRYLGNWEE